MTVTRICEIRPPGLATGLFQDVTYSKLGADPPKLGSVVAVHLESDESVSSIELLAAPGSARAELYHIAARFKLDPVYPEAVLAEAARLTKAPHTEDADLLDLVSLPFVTIDGASARDLDQALYICVDGDGYRVDYALADAAFYIRPSTALFDHALRLGSSFYMPGLTIPMLPHALSEGLISLNPNVIRRALVVRTFLDAMGHPTRTELIPARIKSHAKLTYIGVQAYYDTPESSPITDAPYSGSLDLLKTVGALRIALARERDVVQIQRRYTEVTLGASGLTFEAIGTIRIEVERYNEQISLLCNIEGARLLSEGDTTVQPIFRAHPSPEPRRIRKLEALIDALIDAHQLEPERWRWRFDSEPRESLADYLDRLPHDAEFEPLRLAIERQAVVVNQRSLFQDSPAEHHGIGAPHYARFSSPMREIVGVHTHKEALEMIGRLEEPSDVDSELELRERVIEAGNRSKSIQRSITKEANLVVLDRLFLQDSERALDDRPWRSAIVMGFSTTRVYLQLDEPPIDVKLYVDDLNDTYDSTFELDDAGVMMRTRSSEPPTAQISLLIGQRIHIRVDGYREAERRWFFRVRLALP